jgi:RNA polymerase sigma-70 factor (ECF subfamily)
MTVREYNQCVDKYADRVYRFVLKHLRDSDISKDIVQESFVKLWKHAENVSYEKARAYLFTTAYHTLIDHTRKEKYSSPYESAHEQLQTVDHSYSDLKEILDEALGRLPDVQRAVVLLRDYEGYAYKEIAGLTGLNETQVKVYIYRARTALKEYLVAADRVV